MYVSRALVPVLLAVPLAGTTTAQSPEIETSSSGVPEFLDSFVRAFNNLEWEAFRAHFSDEATVFFPGAYQAERAEGRTEVEAAFEDVFARWRAESSGPPYLDIRPLDVWIQRYGSIAVVTFHLEETEGLNRRTLVLQEDEDAGWRIVHLHASSR